MNKERMKEYYEAFNSGDHEALSKFYADDLIFEYQDTKLNGKEAIIKHFAELQTGFKETIKPTSVLIDGDKVAVEVEDHFDVRVDLPDFLGKSFKAGESFTARFAGFYDTRDNKICHIRLYSF